MAAPRVSQGEGASDFTVIARPTKKAGQSPAFFALHRRNPQSIPSFFNLYRNARKVIPSFFAAAVLL